MDQSYQPWRVRAARCDHRASTDEIEATLRRITDPLERSWQRIEAARCVAIKANVVFPPDHIRLHAGRRQELVDDAVLRGVLTLLREHTSAPILVFDTSARADGADIHFRPLLDEFGAEYVEGNTQPSQWFEVPGGGQMFRRYLFHPRFAEVDAWVSVATLKSHNFMGLTLCSKNLFGLCPMHADNRPRPYFHHPIRLSYVLGDLARTLDPVLNVVDGLVGQTGREWGGQAVVTDCLLAGDQIIATDVCGAELMGHDATADWPTPPFRRDRNHLKLAADHGFGPRSPAEVDFEHDLEVPVGTFDSDATETPAQINRLRLDIADQALYYRDHRDRFVARHPHQYLYLQDHEVIWVGRRLDAQTWRRELSNAKRGRAIWFKYVDPDEMEGERFEVYEQELAAHRPARPELLRQYVHRRLTRRGPAHVRP